jgi:hypothetical protein
MDKTYLGRSIEDFAPGIESKPITKVELLDENGDIVGVAGTDSGKTLTAQNPDGTNEMAQAILAKVSGYTHIGYEGQNAMIDPAAEIGDAVTVSGHYVPIVSTDSIFDSLLAINISAPDADELDDEYPYKSKTQRQIERNMAKTRSLITNTSEEIMLKVEGIDGKYTKLKTTVDGVTITDQSGTTKIKGSSIETASIATNAIRADQVNLTGAITWADLDSNVRAEINDRGDDNPSYIKTTYIDSAKIVSPNIYGGLFYATGQGKNNGAAYYIYDGADIDKYGNVTLGNKIGFISYDTSGTGYDAPRRVIFKTLNDEALKLEAAGNMSLQAKDYIYIHTPLHLASGVHYGTVLPSEGLSPGRLFFLLDE